MLLMALFMPWKAHAQETLTVYENETETSNKSPIYWYFFDAFSRAQTVFPASDLADMDGGTITAIKFYTSFTSAYTSDKNVDVYLAEVASPSISSFVALANTTNVYHGTISLVLVDGKAQVTIELETPYEYHGGNLLFGCDNEEKGTYKNVSFYGKTTSGASVYGSASTYGGATADQSNFLPKTTFTYTPAGGVSCAKPKSLNTVDITAHTATLTWTAGAEGQSNWDVFVTTDATVVPNENTTPTYQVTECTKALSDLTAQTTYYVYVRAVCAADDKSKWANKTFATTREALTVDSNNPYSQNFETSNDWGFENGNLTNQWCWGGATNNGGAKSMYVSKDGGTTYQYAHSNTAIYASKLFNFAQGTYTFSFDWNAKGESNYDYLRVALAPGDVEFTAGTQLFSGVSTNALPNGWIALDGGSKLNLSDGWQTKTAEATVSGTYTMVFIWCNDNGGGDDTPAAIDNISISYMTCPRPTALTASNVAGRTATLSWTENGTATNWVLEYATASDFTGATSVPVSGTASKELTGLSPETKYYARVKSILGDDGSSWSDVKDFTTLATCPKPTLSYVSSSNTAFSGSVSWTGSTADAFEIAYRPTSDFNPSDYTLENVTRIPLENVTESTYTLGNLAPETKYYIYIQANCGEEDGKSQWSNRVTFTTLATCLAPSYLTEGSVSSNSVTLSWTKGAEDQEAWQFRYKKSGETVYSYVLVENHPSNSYELTGLEPATSYDVNVRAWCGGDDYSKWSLVNQTMDKKITTACASITLPYSCDFEGAVETGGHFSSYPVPKCWDRVEMQYGSYSPYTYYPYVNNSNANNGSKCLWMYRTPNSASQTIILPEIDEQYAMTNLQIRFWAKAGSSNNTLSVGIMENGAFSEVQAVEGVSTTYAEYTVLLTNYTGNGRNIAIKCGTSSSYLYYYIDDVKVEEIPSCFIPTGLTNTEVTYNSASFVWQAGKEETEWNIQYKKATDSEWNDNNIVHVTELPTTEHPFVLLGLQRGTDYQARIQAYCDADDQSEWSTMPVSFTTDCGIWPIDEENSLFEDFSNSAFPPCCWNWHRVNNYYGWQQSSGQYNPLDQQGTAYSYWPTGETYLVLPQLHIDGNATLTFDMVFSGTGSGEESTVVLSTTGWEKINFTTTLWTATEFPTSKRTISLDLSAYNSQDIYIAFKYNGVGTSGRMWYIDNVHVYVGEIFTKDITAYSGDGGYYLIASPIGTVSPENVTSMLSNSYDLYYFDQSQDKEWINYKGDQTLGQESHFSIEPGKGYLYANSNNVTLTFTGTPYNGNGQVDLAYNANAVLKGWNLIGNPFGTMATLDKPYYRLNTEGNALKTETENTPIAAMEGVFVQATGAGEKANFTAVRRGERVDVAKLNISVVASTSSSTALDNAIVRFDGGATLGKFQLNPSHTKVYIPQNGKDYAIVRSATQGELPLNFKAEKNGTYTLSFEVENVDLDYLHLIDNLTGADVDLLAGASTLRQAQGSATYTFEAKTTDYASRFRLVFNSSDANEAVCEPSFAYFNGSNWTVSATGSGAATLQVIDMMGRVLSSETISGNTEININQPAGVYMLRLIDNENVRVQKVVVR